MPQRTRKATKWDRREKSLVAAMRKAVAELERAIARKTKRKRGTA